MLDHYFMSQILRLVNCLYGLLSASTYHFINETFRVYLRLDYLLPNNHLRMACGVFGTLWRVDELKMLEWIENLIFVRSLQNNRCNEDFVFLEITGINRITQDSFDLLCVGRKQFEILFKSDLNVKKEKRLIIFEIILVISIILVVDFH